MRFTATSAALSTSWTSSTIPPRTTSPKPFWPAITARKRGCMPTLSPAPPPEKPPIPPTPAAKASKSPPPPGFTPDPTRKPPRATTPSPLPKETQIRGSSTKIPSPPPKSIWRARIRSRRPTSSTTKRTACTIASRGCRAGTRPTWTPPPASSWPSRTS